MKNVSPVLNSLKTNVMLISSNLGRPRLTIKHSTQKPKFENILCHVWMSYGPNVSSVISSSALPTHVFKFSRGRYYNIRCSRISSFGKCWALLFKHLVTLLLSSINFKLWKDVSKITGILLHRKDVYLQ